MANIIPGSPIALEGMPPTDGLLAGIVWLSLTLVGSLRDFCCCTCCRKHGRWRPEYLEGIGYYIVFPSQGPAIFWSSLKKIVEATLWVPTGLRKRARNRNEVGRAQLLKEWHSPRAYLNWLKIKLVQDDKSNSIKSWSSICKLNDTEAPDQF